MHQAAKDGTSELFPVASSATKLGILPGITFSGFKPLPTAMIPIGGHLFDVFIHLSATDIADMKRFTQSENLLIEKAAIHANDDRYIDAVLPFDFDDHMPNHVQHGVAMIGMLVSAPENRIDDETPPVHLQGLKPLSLFVGGFNALPTKGIIIVHHHRIDTQLDQFWLGDLQSPKKKGLQKATKHKYAHPGKTVEKAFDLMGGGHMASRCLDTTGIALIVFELVKVGQMPTGAVYEEAQHLLEKLRYANAFSVFAKCSKPALYPAVNLNLMQIGHEQRQACPACQPIGCDLDAADFRFSSLVIFAMLAHRVLYLLGVAILVITLVGFNKYYSTLSRYRGLFLFGNRSI